MKHVFSKIMLCSIALLMVSATWAQDIIVTTDAKKIEAKILEVSKSEIKYKKTSNPDGPTFVISTDEITTIIYSNGEVELYNQQPATTSQPETPTKPVVAETPVPSTPSVDANTAEILLRSGITITAQITELKSNYIAYTLDGNAYTLPASQIETVTFLQSGQVKEFYEYEYEEEKSKKVGHSYIMRSGNSYLCDGQYLRGKNYELFLQKNCSGAYNQYKNGHAVATVGWVLLGVGLGMDLGFSWWLPYSWIPALSFEIACIPTLITGYVKMHRSADTFNAICAKRDRAYWSINASQNGIGIAYNF